MIKDILEMLFRISVLTFVIGHMLAMGFSLTVKQILEPLRATRLVIFSLVANFIVVPLFVYAMVSIIPVTEGERIGLILLAIAAGSPFMPKLVNVAKSNAAFAIGLMLMLMIITIFYLPLVLPVFLSGAQVSPWAIAKSLITLMLIPLLLALLVRAKLEVVAKALQPIFANLTTIALLVLTITLVILHTKSLIALLGPGMLAIFLLLVFGMAVGYFLGGPGKDTRIVLCLGTGLRNISAAILVATQNFENPEVTLTMIALAVMGLIIMLPFSKKMAKHA